MKTRLKLITFSLSLFLVLAINSVHALQYYVEVQPIQVRADDGSSAATMNFFESETDKIWTQAGIDIVFLDSNTLDETDFLAIDNDPEFSSLTTGAGHGQHEDDTVVNMWFVDDLYPSEPGTTYGVAWIDGNGVAIADETFTFNSGIGRLDTIAHESGHNLGLTHGSGGGASQNLMTSGSTRNVPSSINDITPDGANLDQLTASQISTVLSSGFVKKSLMDVDLFTPSLTDGVTQRQMVETLVGSGVSSISDVTYTGAANASGLFSGGLATGIGIESGVILTSGSVGNAIGPNDSPSTSTDNGLSGSALLDPFVTSPTYDASVLEFEFIPEGNSVTFQYVFASEEYNEWVGSQYNDVFGFFVNGENRAVIPGTQTPVAINNVNLNVNSEYYINNNSPSHPQEPGERIPNQPLMMSADTVSVDSLSSHEYDGQTVVLTLQANVNPGVVNTMQLAIADAGDRIYDSAAFIEEGTFSSDVLPGTPPGATPLDPLLPVDPLPGIPPESFFFGFNPLPGFTFIDPIVAIGYDYEVLSGPNFSSVVLPVLPFGDNIYDLWFYDIGLGDFYDTSTDINAGIEYFFNPGGVSLFRIMGIEPDISDPYNPTGLDPNDPLAFVTGLTFKTLDPIQMTMTPITQDVEPIPEPSTLALLGIGIFGLFGYVWRRRKKLMK